MSNEPTLEVPLDQLRAAFHHYNLCRKETGVEDDDVLLDRIKEMNAEIARLLEALEKIAKPDDAMWPGTNITRDAIKRIAREALAAHAPIAGEKPV